MTRPESQEEALPTLEEITTWLTANQLLVFSLLVPAISAIVAWASAWYSTRRALRTEQSKLGFQSTLKISEFRQNWINELRDSMSDFQSHGILPGNDPTTDREFYRLGTKIELLMNPNDPDYKELSDLMYRFLMASDGEAIDKYGNNAEFIDVCQRILKREWERLKSDLESKTAIR
ncbi:hypothetical protein LCM08_26475 [Salipiger pacificus]|nr:hypothetical protein [Alloyangia pacifica]